MLEAFRYLVTCGLNQGGKPAVMTAMAKYYATETMRKLVNHGMDVVGGRAIQQGPRNFLAFIYQAIPISITVEGANILSRSLMIFGQGSMRCHPYLLEELELLQMKDEEAALNKLNSMLYQHLGYTFNRVARAFTYGFSGGPNHAPSNADDFTMPYYKIINRFSSSFAVTADMCLGLLAGEIKRKEMLSGRLADIHASMFIATAILSFYEHGQRTEAEQIHAKLALEKVLFQAQEAFMGIFDNFPYPVAAHIVKFICFPFGRALQKPSDALREQAGDLIMKNHAFRELLTQHIHYNTDPQDITGRMEATFQHLLQVEVLWDKFKKADSKGQFKGLTFEEQIQDAVLANFMTQDEADRLLDYNAMRYDSMLTDIFDSCLNEVLPLENPHIHPQQ